MRAAFFLLPPFFLLARPTYASLAVGLVLALPGLALRLWASGYIEKTRRLAIGGPYGHTRHPLYLGNLLLAAAFAAASASAWNFALVAGYVLVFYPPLIREEDAFLRQTFPGDFEAWAREVPALFPRFGWVAPRGGGDFRWRRVRANSEWRAWLGWAAAFACLVVMQSAAARRLAAHSDADESSVPVVSTVASHRDSLPRRRDRRRRLARPVEAGRKPGRRGESVGLERDATPRGRAGAGPSTA